LGSGVFKHYNTLLIVPCGSAETYRQHSIWGRFHNIVENCNAIEEVESGEWGVEIDGLNIRVDNRDGETVGLYDMMGRQLASSHLTTFTFLLPASGVYLVKVGDRPAKKVVVVN
jgi:hypothetical protein